MKESWVCPYFPHSSEMAEYSSNCWPFIDIKGPVLKNRFTKSLMHATHSNSLKDKFFAENSVQSAQK